MGGEKRGRVLVVTLANLFGRGGLFGSFLERLLAVVVKEQSELTAALVEPKKSLQERAVVSSGIRCEMFCRMQRRPRNEEGMHLFDATQDGG